MNSEIQTENNEIKVQMNSAGFLTNESGQGMVEYGLIIGLMAMVCLMTMTSLGSSIYNLFFKDLKNNINTNT
ncbi:MAG TPA: Flp family type IVb pilin [Candidatus Wallbacteria bacterium]|nr:Flp family type IVb pilin [Candidatus Wallbacteria bacterium]